MYNISGIQGVVQCQNFRSLRRCKKFVELEIELENRKSKFFTISNEFLTV